MRHVIIMLIALAVPALTHATTLKVPSQYPTIQQAIDAAVNGDTVLVAPGTYVENIDFKGKNVVLTSESGPDVTMIDGQKLDSVVTVMNGEDHSTVVEGFTIANGYGKYYDGCSGWRYYGGGIFCASGSGLTVKGNKIVGNGANTGGGIYQGIGAKDPVIINNIISDNYANNNQTGSAMGGGACLITRTGTAVVVGNVFSGNHCSSSFLYSTAAGVYIDCPNVYLINNTIV